MNTKKTFADRHPKINLLIGLIMLLLICAGVFFFLSWFVHLLGKTFIGTQRILRNFVNSTDKLIVVAMITGTVSIVGVVISSIFAKFLDYRFNVKKYLYDKREEPYKQFIEMIYKMMENTKTSENKKMTDEEIQKMLSDFSKGLTLWGSNRVVKKWLKYRKSSLSGNGEELLFQMEEIIYEIRRDVGLGRKLKKGQMLSFFINDIENIIK
jgi:hypothetical protein